MDRLIFCSVKAALFLLNILPIKIRHFFILSCIRIYTYFSKSFNRISLINLKQAFPEKTEEQRLKILEDSKISLARFIVDSARLSTLNPEWVKEHIECPFKDEYLAIKERSGGKGILIASGHLGSIELQAFAAPMMGRKFSFIARSLNSKLLDDWWKERHERYGNQVISRGGAVSKMRRNLSSGVDVAILIDQNLRRSNAVFVDWFGRKAATTFALAHTALATGAPVVISAITYIGDGKYRVNEHECKIQDIIDNLEIDEETKILKITERVSNDYQKMIINNPGEWFWMHRRWKTTPNGEAENFYS